MEKENVPFFVLVLEKEVVYLGLAEVGLVLVVLLDGVVVADVVVLLGEEVLEGEQRRLRRVLGLVP